jgi:hypothetical protein
VISAERKEEERSVDDGWSRAAAGGVRRSLGGRRARPPPRPSPRRLQARRRRGPSRRRRMRRRPVRVPSPFPRFHQPSSNGFIRYSVPYADPLFKYVYMFCKPNRSFLARAVAWVLRRAAKISIGCRSYGFNYLRGITVSSPKVRCLRVSSFLLALGNASPDTRSNHVCIAFQGAVDSICIGEIRLGLRRPLAQLGFTVLTHGPILQLQISDLDIVLRQPVKSANKKKPSSRKSNSSSPAKSKGKTKGKGKWRLITSMASVLSLSIVELRLKVQHSHQIFELHQ